MEPLDNEQPVRMEEPGEVSCQGRGFSHSALHWGSPTSSPVCNFGFHNIRKTLKLLDCPKEGNKDGEMPWGEAV